MKPEQQRTEMVSLRLTPDQHAKLLALAKTRGLSRSELLRGAVLAEVEEPIGWRCEHLGVMGPAGVLGKPTAPCGCYMAPIFENDRRASETIRRVVAQAHKDDLFEPNSGVAIAPWRPRTAPALTSDRGTEHGH